MEEETIKFEFKVREFKTKSGESLNIDVDKLIEVFKMQVDQEDTRLLKLVESKDKEYEWDKPCDLTTDEGRAKYFIKNFYVNYFGGSSNVGENYKQLIHDTLSCEKYVRMWGYGKDQSGFLHVKEDKETSTKFINYLIDNRIIKLGDYIIHNGDYDEKKKGEKVMTYGHALFIYCVRSNNLELADKFIEYVRESKEYKNIAYDINKTWLCCRKELINETLSRI